MKKAFFQPLAAFFLLIALFTSCSKEDVLKHQPPVPVPDKPAETGTFRFAAALNLTGAPYHTSNLMAVVTIADAHNKEVVKEKALSLDLNGTVKTESLQLPAGNYRLTDFRLVYGGVYTHFATPKAHSARAAQVQQPLALAFAVAARTGAVDVPVEVVRVQNGDRPAHFGYPSGAFDNGQADASPFIKVKIRAEVQVGDIVYDSVPAALALTTWNAGGEMTTTYSHLAAGVNEISLLKASTRFAFAVSKWGARTEITVDRAQINEDTVFVIRNHKAAKKLKSEVTFKLVQGTYRSETRTEYNYDGMDRLMEIRYFRRKADNTPYLAMTDIFYYNGSQLEKINHYNEAKMLTGSTAFTYNPQGKVHTILQDESGKQTKGVVDYVTGAREEVNIRYTYPGNTNFMDYNMIFSKGNLVADVATASNQGRELGNYTYDLQINPYVHMNWPNLFLSNSSKNNKVSQVKNYDLNYPAADPYSFTYTYDNDGYPKEVVTQFKSYPGGRAAFTTKTVFAY